MHLDYLDLLVRREVDGIVAECADAVRTRGGRLRGANLYHAASYWCEPPPGAIASPRRTVALLGEKTPPQRLCHAASACGQAL